MALKTFIEAIRDGLREEMRRDETVIVLGEDVGKKGGVFLATDGLWAEFGDDRVIDTPLTEIADHRRPRSGRRSTASGRSPRSSSPTSSIPAFNQLVSEAARMRYRSNNGYGAADDRPRAVRRRRPRRAVPLPVGRGVLHPRARAEGRHPVDPVRRQGPAPLVDPRRRPGPVLRAQEDVPLSVRGDVPDGEYTVPLGKAQVTHPGTQITVIAYGLMAHYALEAADRVAEEGISVEVVDLRTLRPLDKETVLDSVRKTGKCLIVYEDNRFGGYGAEVAAIVAEEAFDYLDGPVTRIAGPDVPGVPYNHVLEDWFMVNPEKIADGIRKLAAY